MCPHLVVLAPFVEIKDFSYIIQICNNKVLDRILGFIEKALQRIRICSQEMRSPERAMDG
jgi:hypothetical protein